MDRRSFLKVLASLGVAVTLPDLTTAQPVEVDSAWKDAAGRWFLYEVNDYGTLSFANFEAPATRREAYDLPPAAAIDVRIIEDCWPLEEHVEQYFLDLANGDQRRLPGVGYNDNQDWRDSLKSATGDARAELVRWIETWLNEEPNWIREWEWLYTSVDPQGAAYQHLLGEDHAVLKALSIVIIEGDHPGSTYYAAELRIAPEKANDIAERLGLPHRFIREAFAPDTA